jgi:hypothetical protein
MFRTSQLVQLLLAAALLSTPASADSEPTIRVELQQSSTGHYDPNIGELAVLRITLDVQITNVSKNPVDIPEPDKGPDGAYWFDLYSLQSQEADGSWSHVADNGDHMLPGSTQFVPCRSLRPGAVAEMKNVSSGVILYRKQRARLGAKPMVRVVLSLVCKQQNNQLHSVSVTTEPFVLSMPSQP